MKHTQASRWRRRALPAAIGGSRVSTTFSLLTVLPRLGDVGLEHFRGEEPRPPGMVRGRLVLLLSLADRSRFGVELLAVGASLLHFPEDVQLLLDAGEQRAVEGLHDKSLRALLEVPGSQAVRILETGLVIHIMVLDAVARVDGPP